MPAKKKPAKKQRPAAIAAGLQIATARGDTATARRLAAAAGGQMALARLIGMNPRTIRRWCVGSPVAAWAREILADLTPAQLEESRRDAHQRQHKLCRAKLPSMPPDRADVDPVAVRRSAALAARRGSDPQALPAGKAVRKRFISGVKP
jgi:hypothetical protein